MTSAAPITPTSAAEPSEENYEADRKEAADHASLKYSLLGPSLTKAGQDSVDQSKACFSHIPRA